MYITLESPKRKLGLFDLEFQDLIVGGILTIFFIIFFTIEQYQIGLIFILAGIFLLVPVSFSKQNRMYKLIILFIILSIIFVLDWVVYCYEQYQLR